MKNWGWILLLILFSCKKQDVNLGPDFDQIIGKWVSINGDDRIYCNVKKSGVFEIGKSTQRGRKIKFDNIKDISLQVSSGPDWHGRQCYLTNDIYEQFKFFKKEGVDDTVIFLIGDYVENFASENKDYLFVRDGN